MKWRQLILAEYNTDIMDKLYQAIEKKEPVSAECLLKSTLLLWQWRLIYTDQPDHSSFKYSGFHQY